MLRLRGGVEENDQDDNPKDEENWENEQSNHQFTWGLGWRSAEVSATMINSAPAPHGCSPTGGIKLTTLA